MINHPFFLTGVAVGAAVAATGLLVVVAVYVMAMRGHKPTRGFPVNHRHGGFTLVELLVVVAIISILLTIAIAVGSSIRSSSMITSTRSTLHALHDASLILWEDGQDRSKTPVLSADPRAWKRVQGLPKDAGGGVVDAWGNAVEYVATMESWRSAGPDGKMGTADDLYDSEAP